MLMFEASNEVMYMYIFNLLYNLKTLHKVRSGVSMHALIFFKAILVSN